MTSTQFIDSYIGHGTVLSYQTGWAYTVLDESGNDYFIRNVTYASAALAKAAMRECVEQHNERKKRQDIYERMSDQIANGQDIDE